MRVLYVAFHPDALSESYIRTEVEWMQAQGVDICMLAASSHTANYVHTISPDNLMFGTNLEAAVEKFKPDIVHVHWLMLIDWYLRAALKKGIGVPVSYRGHSFDYSIDRVKEAASFPDTKVIWLFPHFAKEVGHLFPCVKSLSACFTTKRYYPYGMPNVPLTVMRTFAGLPSKKIEDWLHVASLCPDVPFHLVMTKSLPPFDEHIDEVRRQAPANVTVSANLSHEEVASAMRRAAVYLVTRPKHRFGMPVSITEALGAGLMVMLPNDPDLWAFQGACSFYNTLEEAAEYVRAAVKLDARDWFNVKVRSVNHSIYFRDENVLPWVLGRWNQIKRGETDGI